MPVIISIGKALETGFKGCSTQLIRGPTSASAQFRPQDAGFFFAARWGSPGCFCIFTLAWELWALGGPGPILPPKQEESVSGGMSWLVSVMLQCIAELSSLRCQQASIWGFGVAVPAEC